jgi:hypothetical protein
MRVAPRGRLWKNHELGDMLMAGEGQITANRANARKSTGPPTGLGLRDCGSAAGRAPSPAALPSDLSCETKPIGVVGGQ